MPDKILIVDDEQDILRIIAFSLQKWGYEIVTATNGKEGLDKIASENPDLVLLDAGMPVMTGFEMLEQLRKTPGFEDTPVIMLTAHSDSQNIATARKYGILEYVTKPFDPIELRERIGSVLSHSK
jgi:DNA-binding response OmpR family regulator